VIDGCTIVSNPTPTNFTNCPGVDFTGADLNLANLSGVDLSFANLAGAQFATCNTFQVSCAAANLAGANLTDANLSSASFAICELLGVPQCADADLQNAVLIGANLTDAVFASCSLTGQQFAFCGEPPTIVEGEVNLSGANLTDATVTGATFGACLTSGSLGGPWEDCGGATLTGANLTGVNLTGIDLSGTTLVPSYQSVTATSAAGAVVTWPTPPSLPGATPGSCTPSSGSAFPISVFPPNAVTCQVVDGQGDVTTGTFLVTVGDPPPPTTSVLLPSNGATVSGGIWLDARASSPIGLRAPVTFLVSGGPDSISFLQVSIGFPTLYGYIGGWDTTDVPNGTYTLQSAATDNVGQSTDSAGITVTVNNPPPATSVLIPSAGATLSAPGASSVTFELTGGTLSNQVIASGTLALWGWYAEWNTTTVPNGTYTLQSVATEPGGSIVTSAPVTVTVSN
jgi:uncharacterized protein YjbI with pentapeptide repeats